MGDSMDGRMDGRQINRSTGADLYRRRYLLEIGI